jgi:hypothetical protein
MFYYGLMRFSLYLHSYIRVEVQRDKAFSNFTKGPLWVETSRLWLQLNSTWQPAMLG